MLYKLAFKNIKKSIKDYAIYFFTLILGVSIFYVFNALESQTVLMKVSSYTAELIKLMMMLLSSVSIFVSFILGFLIIYASRFLMKRRNKEFAIYLTLGMSKRKISLILFFETLLIGIISLFVGIIFGVILSQFMSILVSNMFEADLTKFRFVFSVSAFGKTIIYFSIMYLIVIIFNTFSISKCKLIDLFNISKKAEKVKLKRPIICMIVFVISIIILARAYYIVTVDFLSLNDVKDIIKPIIMGVVATFLIFWSLSGLLLKMVKSLKKVYYKNLNSFTLREFSSKINTTVFSITIICLMLFITICLLSSCLTIKNSMNANLIKLTPADIEISTLLNMENNYDKFRKYGYNDAQIINSKLNVIDKFKKFNFDITSYLKDYIEVNLYSTDKLTMNDTLGSKLDVVKKSYPFLKYDTYEQVMKISDYNKVATMYNLKTYSLYDNQYMVIADFDSMVKIRNIPLKNKENINVFGHVLKPKYKTCQDGFLDMSSQHINVGIFLVPDNVVDDNYLYENFLIGNYKTKNKEEIRKIEDNIKNLENNELKNTYLLPSSNTKLDIKETTVGLSAMVTFIGLYLGIIFLISSAAMLGLKELSESSDNKEKFSVLRKIGATEKMIDKTLFNQIAIFFLLPLILAVIHSIFGITFAVKILEVFGKDELLISIIMTFIFIIFIYGGYFLITYYSSKNIIKKR